LKPAAEKPTSALLNSSSVRARQRDASATVELAWWLEHMMVYTNPGSLSTLGVYRPAEKDGRKATYWTANTQEEQSHQNRLPASTGPEATE
jgi:hypothetical protein